MGSFRQIVAWILVEKCVRINVKIDLKYYVRKSIEQIEIVMPKIQRKIISALKNIGKIDKKTCDEMLKTIAVWKDSEQTELFYEEIEEDLKFYFHI